MRIFFAAFMLAYCPAMAFALHSPLLPCPQNVSYRPGNINVKGLTIIVPTDAAVEDRFAMSRLADGLSDIAGVRVSASSVSGDGKSISFSRTGGIEALPQVGETTGAGSREAYQLAVSEEGVKIQARTTTGIFYAAQTLLQLVEGSGKSAILPFVEIEDWPEIPYRGTMIDMSEGPLATEAEVLRQLDEIAKWKGNQYYFYNEDSIELSGYPLLNPQAQFSKAQIRHVIDYARARHIDVVPCLELYGHQHDLFRIEKFSTLADFAHGGEFDPLNPQVKKLLADWTDQYLDLFPSEFVHIGFDETWEITRAAKVKGSGSTPAILFLKQLNAVAQPFIANKKMVLAWGDIVVKFPGIANQIPEGVAIVPWWYEPDPDPAYTKWLAPLVSNHVPLFVAPGVNMWTEMTPDFEKSFRNIDTFPAAGKKAGARGIINTMWTDNQEGLRRMAWPGMAYGAIASWQRQPVDKDLFFIEYSQLSYPARAVTNLAAALQELTAAETLAQKIWGVEDMDAQWSSPFEPKRLARLKEHREDLHQMRLHAEEAEGYFLAVEHDIPSGSLNAFLFGSRVLDYAGMRSLYAIEIDDLWAKEKLAGGGDADLWELVSGSFSRTHGRVGDLTDALSLLIPDYQANWLAEYTPYRMETALMHWQREDRYWAQAQSSFERFEARYKKGTPLPSLDELIGSYDGR